MTAGGKGENLQTVAYLRYGTAGGDLVREDGAAGIEGPGLFDPAL